MRFVTLIRFTPTGAANVHDSTQRAKKFIESAQSAGMKVQELLWTQGAYDGLVLFDAPDVETAAATMLGLASDGNVQTQTMVAFDAAAMDKVVAKIS